MKKYLDKGKDIIINLFTPFGNSSNKVIWLAVGFQIVLLFVYLQLNQKETLPHPIDVGKAVIALVASHSFWDNLMDSVLFIIPGLGKSILITMLICYLWTLPFFRMSAELITKLRFLTFACVMFLFGMLNDSMDGLKEILLLFGIIPFFTTSFLSVISTKDTYQQLEKSYINKKGKWESLYEVVIVGKMDMLFEVMRQNMAFAWAMITSIESITMGQGGIGTLIIKSNRSFHIADIFAIAIIIIVIGIIFDVLLVQSRKALFVYIRNSKK
jgi:NitT/TauT family transport system permease protein